MHVTFDNIVDLTRTQLIDAHIDALDENAEHLNTEQKRRLRKLGYKVTRTGIEGQLSDPRIGGG